MHTVFNQKLSCLSLGGLAFLFGERRIEINYNFFWKAFSLIFVGPLLIISFVSNSESATEYSITDLGPGIAMDINQSGQVVGQYSPDGLRNSGFYWDSATGRENVDIDGDDGFLGINDNGEAVQLDYGSPPTSRIWNSSNGITEEVPIFGRAINDSRSVTGWITGGPSLEDTTAVVWDETNGVQAIGGGIEGSGRDINDYGQVAGIAANSTGAFDAFLWDEINGLHYIPTLGGTTGGAYGINNLGQVTGTSGNGTERHAFFWDETGGIQDLGTLGYRPSGSKDNSTGHDVNMFQQVVGVSNAASPSDPNGAGGSVAFIWDSTNGMLDLNNLIPDGSGWVLGTAFAINDSGQIVGYGYLEGEEGWRAFLLTPLPEPTIDSILLFFDEAVANGTLEGYGPGKSANGRLNALRNMLEMTGDLINIGDIEGACGQLKAALKKCDGKRKPPDFVAGSAVSDLNNMILELMEELGCE